MNKKRIPLEECKHGFLYRIWSRNLAFGVFNEDTKGFVGIREKFGSEYLFEEYHYDTGPPFGTVLPKFVVEKCPHEDLRESGDTIDSKTRRPVKFDKPIKDGGRGWYFLDTDEASEEIMAVAECNQKLFDWLNEREKAYCEWLDRKFWPSDKVKIVNCPSFEGKVLTGRVMYWPQTEEEDAISEYLEGAIVDDGSLRVKDERRSYWVKFDEPQEDDLDDDVSDGPLPAVRCAEHIDGKMVACEIQQEYLELVEKSP
jgi:hypothetical protein